MVFQLCQTFLLSDFFYIIYITAVINFYVDTCTYHINNCLFIPTGLLHLLPEVAENMESAFDELLDGEQEYPFAYFVVCIGFLIVLVIEHLVLSCEVNKKKLKENEASRETNIYGGLPGNIYIVDFY